MSSFRHLFVVVVLAGAISAPLTTLAAQDTAHSTGEAWQIISLPQASRVYARDGSLIGAIGREDRKSITIASIPKYVGEAFIAVEDQRFYEHDGVDIKSTAAAALGKVLGNNRGGGSTITQQVVGYMHPDIIDRREKTGAAGIERKLREQAAAREMERHYSKAQILEAYLNVTYFGRGWYGIESAAQHYFGHPAARLTLAEAATLAALPKSQPYYDPISHPDRSRDRRNLVLSKMAEQGLITPEQAEKAEAEPVVVAPNGGMTVAAGYFVDAVKQQAERSGIPVMNGGYDIFTTLDPALQRAAVSAVVDGTNKIEAQKNWKHLTQAEAKGSQTDYLQAMAVAIDPYTGDVRALVGGRNYARAPFNRAITALRQPGSSFKPFVYAAAIADSIPVNAVVPDTSLEIPLPEGGEPYSPSEDDGKFWGTVSMADGKPNGMLTLREALKHSRNVVAVELGMRVGMDSVAALAHRLGISTPIAPVPADAIGAAVVHPIDMVAAYTAFADNGAVVQPRFITAIKDLRGRVVFQRPPSTPQQVLDPRVAFIVRDMMRDVAEHGTGVEARAAVPSNIPIAGKTGTTNDNKDLWFVGMTPEVVAAVWVGFDKPKMVQRVGAASTLAAPIWGQMIGRYYAGRSTSGWPAPPDGLVYADLDRDTAGLATPLTPPDRRYTEYFLPGTEPPELRNNPWKVPQFGPLFVPAKSGGAR